MTGKGDLVGHMLWAFSLLAATVRLSVRGKAIAGGVPKAFVGNVIFPAPVVCDAREQGKAPVSLTEGTHK